MYTECSGVYVYCSVLDILSQQSKFDMLSFNYSQHANLLHGTLHLPHFTFASYQQPSGKLSLQLPCQPASGVSLPALTFALINNQGKLSLSHHANLLLVFMSHSPFALINNPREAITLSHHANLLLVFMSHYPLLLSTIQGKLSPSVTVPACFLCSCHTHLCSYEQSKGNYDRQSSCQPGSGVHVCNTNFSSQSH